jgi:1-acyl-sn-glycerol-3-phosphate acyltransferase
MRKFLAVGRMVFVCTFIALYLLVIGGPVLSYCRLRRNPQLALRLTRLLARMVVFLGGVRLTVEGLEKLSKDRGYVYVSNHRSLVDSAVPWITLPGDIRFLAKKELFKIPMVSFALSTMGMIAVDRSNSDAAARSIDRAVTEIRSGRSIILFPEGTRSREPGLLRFKKGAFVLAINAQAPIVPITIIGADAALPPDTMFLYGGAVQLIVHDPIPTEGMDFEQRDTLLQQARNVIENTYVRRTAKAQASTIR